MSRLCPLLAGAGKHAWLFICVSGVILLPLGCVYLECQTGDSCLVLCPRSVLSGEGVTACCGS